MKIHRGDLLPDLIITLTDNGVPVDLTGATSVHVIGIKNRTVVFNREATADAEGSVTMVWEAADTSSTGTIKLQVRVVWPTSKPQTFPVDEDIEVLPSYHTV